MFSTSAIIKFLKYKDLDGLSKFVGTACTMNPLRVYVFDFFTILVM